MGVARMLVLQKKRLSAPAHRRVAVDNDQAIVPRADAGALFGDFQLATGVGRARVCVQACVGMKPQECHVTRIRVEYVNYG